MLCVSTQSKVKSPPTSNTIVGQGTESGCAFPLSRNLYYHHAVTQLQYNLR